MPRPPASESISPSSGRRNAGKSSLVNAFTGQDLAIVSDVKGTTTDPVSKAMELLPLGPVQIIDTPGLDDEGNRYTYSSGPSCAAKNRSGHPGGRCHRPPGGDGAGAAGPLPGPEYPLDSGPEQGDLLEAIPEAGADTIYVSAKTGYHIHELKELPPGWPWARRTAAPWCRTCCSPGDTAVLVVPIDKAAPKGRLILPQQQVIRDALEAGAAALVCRETELAAALQGLNARRSWSSPTVRSSERWPNLCRNPCR